MTDDEILLVLKSQGWTPAPYVEMDEDEIIAFARDIAEKAINEIVEWTIDDGWVGEQYAEKYRAAIRARSET